MHYFKTYTRSKKKKKKKKVFYADYSFLSFFSYISEYKGFWQTLLGYPIWEIIHKTIDESVAPCYIWQQIMKLLLLVFYKI